MEVSVAIVFGSDVGVVGMLRSPGTCEVGTPVLRYTCDRLIQAIFWLMPR